MKHSDFKTFDLLINASTFQEKSVCYTYYKLCFINTKVNFDFLETITK